AEIRKILAEVDGTVRWGGDFSGTKDEMHFEIVGTGAQVAQVARRIKNGGPVKEIDMDLDNILLNPTGNETRVVRINCPTGAASALVNRAWLSATVIGPEPGWVHRSEERRGGEGWRWR